MQFTTRDFGEIDIDAKQVIMFQQPIFGFDGFHRYAFLYDPEAGRDIAWLQSLEEPELCFILVNPQAGASVYQPVFPKEVYELIGEGSFEYWAIAVVKEDFTRTTINLKSPVIINWQTGRGAQIILDGDYPLRQPLIGEAAAPC